jgi:RimJ/RimL family protein N-acetyltransferase
MIRAKNSKPIKTIAQTRVSGTVSALADGRFGETPRGVGWAWGPGQLSGLKGAERGGYGAEAAGRLSFFMLITPRLILRPQTSADAPALFVILSDERAMRFWNRSTIGRLAVVEELVREQQAAMAAGQCCYWTLFRDGEAVGSIDLSLIQSGSAELGFMLRPELWGQGLASEAVGAVIAHAFDGLGLTRLAAAVQSANRAAARVLEKNSFTRIESRPVLLASGVRAACDFYLCRR